MSDHAPPMPPKFRPVTCATCTNEVLVDFYDEGPAQCEFCSGAMKPHHEVMREQRKVVDETAPPDNAAFLERVDAVLQRAVPNPNRPGAFGCCPYCRRDYVLKGESVVHPDTPCWSVR